MSEELSQKTCVPCRGGIPPMGREEAEEYISKTPGWELNDEATRISREFTFESFPAAIEFVKRVAAVAEEEGHHPDLEIRYRDVRVVLWTHKIDGLHENDFIMAAKINQVARSFQPAEK